MNTKAVNTARNAPPPRPVSAKDKEEAKQCLILADKFLKEGDFENARQEVSKAQQADPSNPYAYAFLDRIAHFEEQKKKSAPPPSHPPTVEAKQQVSPPPAPTQPVAAPPPTQPKPVVPPAQKPSVPPPPAPPKPAAPIPKPAAVPPLPPPKVPSPPAQKHSASPLETKQMVEASKPVIADVLAARSASSGEKPKTMSPMAEVIKQIVMKQKSMEVSQQSPSAAKGDIDGKLDEMRRQIEMLTHALDQERKVREEMNQHQLQGAIKKLRSAMERAWVNGAPKEHEIQELLAIATSLGVPEDVVSTLQREIKLDMYSRAVKEVVAKQKLLRSSSRTLEWLRKVYQVTMDEYLEYESKFLMDLVADQYKGTILLVSSDEGIARDLVPQLKSAGYAIVTAGSPENALEKIEKINPHYILCDMEFSAASLSGVKFLHVLRANSKFNYIPFILLCEKGDMTQLKSSELRPTEGYIEKPIELENLNEMMNEKLMQFRHYLSSL